MIGRRTGHAWEQFDLPLFLNQMGKPLLLCMGNTAPVVYRNKVSILHDVTFLRYPQTFSKKFLMFYRLVIPWVLLTSRHVFTVSNFSLEEIVSSYKIDRNKISVVYNAVDQKFACVEDKGLSADKYLFTVSSIKVNKNFGVAVNAFKIIQKRIPDLKLYIMGDMNADSFRNMGNLIEECSKNPNIKLLGRVSDNDLIRYYSNAVAFIFPSLYEGFGIRFCIILKALTATPKFLFTLILETVNRYLSALKPLSSTHANFWSTALYTTDILFLSIL